MPDESIVKFPTPDGAVHVATRAQVEQCPAWATSFADHRQDYRYYRIVEDTIVQGFEYRYFVLEDAQGTAKAIQPFFLLDQDLLGGAGKFLQRMAGGVRKIFPRFLFMRTLMVGCAAGEGLADRHEGIPGRLPVGDGVHVEQRLRPRAELSDDAPADRLPRFRDVP